MAVEPNISSVHEAYDDLPRKDWKFMFITSYMIDDADNYDPKLIKGEAILRNWKQRAETFGEPFRTLHQSIPEGTKCWHGQLSYWVPQEWDNHNGTVTLLGDAAHPMSFRTYPIK